MPANTEWIWQPAISSASSTARWIADTVASMAQTASVFALHPEWYHPPGANEVVQPVMDEANLDAAQARLDSLSAGPRPDAGSAVARPAGLEPRRPFVARGLGVFLGLHDRDRQ